MIKIILQVEEKKARDLKLNVEKEYCQMIIDSIHEIDFDLTKNFEFPFLVWIDVSLLYTPYLLFVFFQKDLSHLVASYLGYIGKLTYIIYDNYEKNSLILKIDELKVDISSSNCNDFGILGRVMHFLDKLIFPHLSFHFLFSDWTTQKKKKKNCYDLIPRWRRIGLCFVSKISSPQKKKKKKKKNFVLLDIERKKKKNFLFARRSGIFFFFFFWNRRIQTFFFFFFYLGNQVLCLLNDSLKETYLDNKII